MSRSLSRLRPSPDGEQPVLDITPLPPVPSLPPTRDRPSISHSRKPSMFRLEEDDNSDIQRALKMKMRQSRHVRDVSTGGAISLKGAALAARDDSAVRQMVMPPKLRRVSRSFTNLRLLATRDALQAEDQATHLLQAQAERTAKAQEGNPLIRPLPLPPTPDHRSMSHPRKAPEPPKPLPPTPTPPKSKSKKPTKAPALTLPALPPKPAPIGEQPIPASRTMKSRILSAATISRMKAMSPASMMSTFASPRPSSRDSNSSRGTISTSASSRESNESRSTGTTTSASSTCTWPPSAAAAQPTPDSSRLESRRSCRRVAQPHFLPRPCNGQAVHGPSILSQTSVRFLPAVFTSLRLHTCYCIRCCYTIT
ncbi:hypothetical protein EXIGLDRAFT_720635 [Exidia glandulosa HHB12029]|uniref:Uncharacterized protein n=1 Tax=Exidia glandulosa HHB12029 TaxID=1314781 RepID=A0A165G8X0_EXIGL|nr:hypothetical protein EXIGLDRAFT_720635 [Exidia glandulosa HHB12029]